MSAQSYTYYVKFIIYATKKWWRFPEGEGPVPEMFEKGVIDDTNLKHQQSFLCGSPAFFEIVKYLVTQMPEQAVVLVREQRSSWHFRLYFISETVLLQFFTMYRQFFLFPFVILKTVHGPNFSFPALSYFSLMQLVTSQTVLTQGITFCLLKSLLLARQLPIEECLTFLKRHYLHLVFILTKRAFSQV